MEALLEEHEKLVKKGNLSKSVEDVQKTIDLLVQARESIAASTRTLHHAANFRKLQGINADYPSLRPTQRSGHPCKAPDSC